MSNEERERTRVALIAADLGLDRLPESERTWIESAVATQQTLAKSWRSDVPPTTEMALLFRVPRDTETDA